MKTVFDIIDAVLRDYFGKDMDEFGFLATVHGNFGIKFDRFTAILCSPSNPMYSSRRTIREKWKLLHDLGYLTKVNQRASKIEISKIYTDFYDAE